MATHTHTRLYPPGENDKGRAQSSRMQYRCHPRSNPPTPAHGQTYLVGQGDAPGFAKGHPPKLPWWLSGNPLAEEMATPSIFLSGDSQGQRSQAGYSRWDRKSLSD